MTNVYYGQNNPNLQFQNQQGYPPQNQGYQQGNPQMYQQGVRPVVQGQPIYAIPPPMQQRAVVINLPGFIPVNHRTLSHYTQPNILT